MEVAYESVPWMMYGCSPDRRKKDIIRIIGTGMSMNRTIKLIVICLNLEEVEIRLVLNSSLSNKVQLEMQK